MGNIQWVMGSQLFFVSILFIATTRTCLGNQNMSFCNEQERLDLLKFKQSVSDELGMLSSWVGKDCCQWKGVHCDAATKSVVSLRLTGHNIWNSLYFPESNPADIDSTNKEDYYPVGEDNYLAADELSASLVGLKNLKYLDLSGNNFRKSKIPGFIGSLKHLSYLNLSYAGFSGNIPSQIGNLSKLEVLDLSARHQDLEVDDLAWVFRLLMLKHLNLSGADLTGSQNVNMVLYMIPSLEELSLSHCSLNNAHLVPYLNLSRTLPNIKYLDLSKNFFSGDQLPPFLQNMTSLTFLDISNSDFSIPLNLASILNTIPSLSELHLSDCNLRSENLSPTNLNSSVHSNIQHLDLSQNIIEGRFPSLLTNISSLRVLDLHSNFINSFIPIIHNLKKLDISSNNFTDMEHVGIWRQCHLKYLSVSRNYLREGMISMSTNTSECSKHGLEVLYLDQNQLNGSVSDSLIRLTNLRVLDLSSNNLTNLIPRSLGRLRALEVLDISSNKLNGNIPISFGQLSNLKFLNVSNNNLEGMVSESHFSNVLVLAHLDISFISKLTVNVSRDWIPPFNLTTLQLSSCKIADDFPHWLRTQTNLKKLVLSDTSISGPLPTWFEQMPIIPHLDLSNNNLTGPLTKLPFGDGFSPYQDAHKGSLFLQNNLFTGSIPWSLCRRIALEVLDISRNKLTGRIPTCLDNLQKLRGMALGYNGLSGVIPSSIGRISLLSWLHLNDNNFVGELPQDMSNLEHLWVLNLGNNALSGKIPEWISKLTELIVLRLNKNNFTGRIPQSLCKNACLQIFDVAQNKLKGPIPQCLEELSGMIDLKSCRPCLYSEEKVMIILKGWENEYTKGILPFTVYMDLSSNELVGTIPEELTQLIWLVGLNVSNNNLNGNIPEKIGNMKSLESLDFSVNQLSGTIPPSVVDMSSLSYLNLSHNKLSGRIPTGGQLQTLTDLSLYDANEDLCGPTVAKICPNPVAPTTTTRKKKNKKVWFYLDVMCGFVTGFLGIIGALFFNEKWRNDFYRLAWVIMDYIYVTMVIKINSMKRQGEDI